MTSAQSQLTRYRKRKSRSDRHASWVQRPRQRLGLEVLEPRIVLSDTSELIDLNSSAVATLLTSDGSNRLSGSVYLDTNGDGLRDEREIGVPGVQIALTGSDTSGQTITRTLLTASDGSFAFDAMPSGTYQLAETQPQALIDGLDSTTMSGAVTGSDEFTNLVLDGGQDAGTSNFGELGLRARFITIAWFLTSKPPVEEMLRETIAWGEELAGNLSLAEAIRNGDSEFPDDANASPVAASDAYAVDEDNVLTVAAATGVLANDSDADGDALTAQLVNLPTHGAVALSADGSFVYTPNANFNGTDAFTYLANDGGLTSGTATVTLSIGSVADTPVAVADSYSVDEDDTLSVGAATGLLANDTDADADTLTSQLVSLPTHGAVTLSADGSFVYTPNADFNGADAFTYLANDGGLTSGATTVTLTIGSVADTPAAMADSYSVDEDDTLSVAAVAGILANDTDADGDALTAQLVSLPTHGAVTLSADGSFVYTPNANFNGTDAFTYQANDGGLTSDTATVTLIVNHVNSPAQAVDDAYTVNEDSLLAVDAVFGLLANDTDVDGDVLSAVLFDPPDHGQLSLNDDGSLSYTPDADFNGTDTFSYQADDGVVASNPAIVTVDVVAVDDTIAVALPAEFSNAANVAARTVGETIDFTVAVADPDSASHVFQLDLEASGIPGGEALPTIDSGSGRFLWTPSSTGRFQIRVVVVNSDGEADQETFLIDILPDPEEV